MNAINSIYFSFAALFFCFISRPASSNLQTSPCVPPFIPDVRPSLHPLAPAFLPPLLPFSPVFISYPLHPFFCPSLFTSSISPFCACICLETSLSPDFLSGRLYFSLSVYLCLHCCHYILKLINGVRLCVCFGVRLFVCMLVRDPIFSGTTAPLLTARKPSLTI